MKARIFGLRRPRRSGRAVWAVYLAVIVGLLGAALVTPSAAAPGGASTVGDYVWFDYNLDGEHVGAGNASEAEYTAGIAGVVVELWRWDTTSATWVLDGTTTTDATGRYEFPATALATQYEVVIADSNFLPGGPLHGYIYTSASTYPQPFGMPDVLVYDYRDADFGFAQSPLQVSKALVNTSPYTVVGDMVTFRITVTNSSTALTLDPVPLDDFYSPACLTYVTASVLPTSVNTATGWLHWDNVGPLAPGQSVVIDVQFTAANTQEMAWKEGGWQDYAPKGIPDFDQRQTGWDAPAGSGTGWYQCGPVAAANSLWWFDSKWSRRSRRRSSTTTTPWCSRMSPRMAGTTMTCPQRRAARGGFEHAQHGYDCGRGHDRYRRRSASRSSSPMQGWPRITPSPHSRTRLSPG